MQIARFEPRTSVEGPGERSVVWFQGCRIGCRDCCNPEMHDSESGISASPSELADMIVKAGSEGLTLLGGEPLDQVTELIEMLEELKKGYRHGIIMFSGYTYEKIMADDLKEKAAGLCDLLIAGPFMPEFASPDRRWIGSDNQTIHFMSSLYVEELKDWPPGKKEIEIIIRDGVILINGTPLADDHDLVRMFAAKLEG